MRPPTGPRDQDEVNKMWLPLAPETKMSLKNGTPQLPQRPRCSKGRRRMRQPTGHHPGNTEFYEILQPSPPVPKPHVRPRLLPTAGPRLHQEENSKKRISATVDFEFRCPISKIKGEFADLKVKIFQVFHKRQTNQLPFKFLFRTLKTKIWVRPRKKNGGKEIRMKTKIHHQGHAWRKTPCSSPSKSRLHDDDK